MILSLKKILPTQIILKTKIENIQSKPSEENTKEYTSKQIEKQKIILKLKEEYANGKSMRKLAEEYPVLKKYKYFYQRFKEYLTNLNVLCLLNLLNSNHEEECINKYILSLKKDWEAVINAGSIGLSNGVTEGNVNKIKQIKRDMYGRASYELLIKKVIYQSLFS